MEVNTFENIHISYEEDCQAFIFLCRDRTRKDEEVYVVNSLTMEEMKQVYDRLKGFFG